MAELSTFVPISRATRDVAVPAAIEHQALDDKLLGAWVLILIESATFAAYFVIYMLYRMHDPRTFTESQVHLSSTFGLVNTLILLASSWQMARGAHAARSNQYDVAWRQALITSALGITFVISKLSEWYFEIQRGFTFETNDFFAFYFFLTGIHVVHVLIGFIFIGVGMYKLRDSEASAQALEIASVYWHMVDFLWVVIFAMLYVMR